VVHIENICPDFFAFWERAQGRNRPDQVDLWRSLYEDRHRDIFEVYYGTFGRREGLEQALDRFPQAVPRMRVALASAEESMGRVVPRCAHLFEAPEADIRSVLMVGLFQSDAWATSLRGRPTSFLTLEHVTDPRWLEITVAHETAHTLHHLCASTPLADWVDSGTVGEGLFTRAIAFKFALAPQFSVLNGNDAAHPAEHLAIGPYEPATVILRVTETQCIKNFCRTN